MIPPPTLYSRDRVNSPPSTSDALAVVPPMSRVMTSGNPTLRARAWAPTTPPAGPDSMMLHGSRMASSTVVSPPFDCMSITGASTDASASSRRSDSR